MSGERRDDCEAFAAVVNAVLDGDAPAAGLAVGHPLGCPDCRALAAAARVLAVAGPALRVPPGATLDLRPRLVRTVARVRRRRRWAPALAAGSALAFGAWLAWPEPVGRAVVVGPAVSDPPRPSKDATGGPRPVRVTDQWATVASVARSASEKATAPVRVFAPPTVPLAPRPAAVAPDLAALAPLGKAGKATAEPVAGATRRAVGLFLRDLGLSSPSKPAG